MKPALHDILLVINGQATASRSGQFTGRNGFLDYSPKCRVVFGIDIHEMRQFADLQGSCGALQILAYALERQFAHLRMIISIRKEIFKFQTASLTENEAKPINCLRDSQVICQPRISQKTLDYGR